MHDIIRIQSRQQACTDPTVAPSPCRFGTARQREALLPELTSLQKLGAYCLTEPGAGSDAASLTTRAKRNAATGGYTLHGAKAFISGAGVADLYVVLARTGEAGPRGISAFLVDKVMCLHAPPACMWIQVHPWTWEQTRAAPG